MTRTAEQPAFDALDACHRQIQEYLFALKGLAERLATQGVDDEVRAQAGAIEAFFSSTSRKHHAEEEAKVFPALLASGSPELATAVRTLQQDHGWIDETEFLNYAEVFVALMEGHIALEETLIYPESKARWAQAVAGRLKRLDAAQGA